MSDYTPSLEEAREALDNRAENKKLAAVLQAALRQCGISVSYAISGPAELWDVASIIRSKGYARRAPIEDADDMCGVLGRLNRTIEAQGPNSLLVQARDAVEKLIRDRDIEGHIAELRLERLLRILKPSDAVIVDMLTAFYGEKRDGWSIGKVRRMRAALEAAFKEMGKSNG